MGRPRNRRTVVASEAAGADLRAAINNLELAERRYRDGQPLLAESVGELEQRLTDPGWARFTAGVAQEFTDTGRQQMRDVCRLMTLANPLLVRGTGLRCAYVHGGGVQRTARANGHAHDGEQDVQAVVSAFLDDDGNARSFTGAAARERLERTLATDGEFFVALVTRPLTGEVQTRVVLADEIADIICNPEDRSEPWYYRREWTERQYTADGSAVEVRRELMHPCVDYRPATRPKSFAGVQVAWDKPVLHVAVNRPEHWLHGVPDVYSAINWARAYKTFLEQWASLVAALSKFAWRTTAAGSKQATAIRGRIAATATPADASGPDAVGRVAITEAGQLPLEAIPKSGATVDAESGRPLAMMVAAALGVPVTMLLGDPGLTGARATAETLDLPTELTMGQRREVWTATDRRILRYAITEAVRAPQGPLKGTIRRDRFRDRELVELAGDTDATVDVDWPDLSDTTITEKIGAIVAANATGTVPPEVVLRLLLAALGLRDADTIIEAMVGDDGAFRWPGGPPLRDATRPTASTPAGDTTAGDGTAGDGTSADATAGLAETALTEADQPDQPGHDDAWTAAVAAFLAAWPAIAGPMVAELTAGTERVARTGNLTALGGLAVSTPTVQAAGRALADAMISLAGQTATATTADAASQGATTDVPPVDTDRLQQVAAATAALIAAGYAAAAGRAALTAAPGTAGTAVRTVLTGMATADRGLVGNHVRASMSAAEHEGRRAVFTTNPPTELRASEHHDRGTCDPCKNVDGRTYTSVAEALADYPVAGYVHCLGNLGGHACRGQLKGLWR